MAQQVGPIYFTGTLHGLTFYRMDGQYYVRQKSSLTRKRFRKDPAFARSRQRAAQFGIASGIAKTIYRALPQKQRGHGVIGKLTGKANNLLQGGATEGEVLLQLQQQCGLIQVQHPRVQQASAPPAPKGALSLSRWKVSPKGLVARSPLPVLILGPQGQRVSLPQPPTEASPQIQLE